VRLGIYVVGGAGMSLRHRTADEIRHWLIAACPALKAPCYIKRRPLKGTGVKQSGLAGLDLRF